LREIKFACHQSIRLDESVILNLNQIIERYRGNFYICGSY
jgi:hypothetical protein